MNCDVNLLVASTRVWTIFCDAFAPKCVRRQVNNLQF